MGTTQVAVMVASDIEQLQDDVSELTTKLNGLVIQYNKVSSDMTLNKVKFDTVLSEFSQVVADMGTNKNVINEVKATANTLKSNMNTNKNVINEIKGQYNNAKADVAELRSKMVTMTSLVNNLRTDLQAVQLMITEDGGGTYSGASSSLDWSDDGILAKLKKIEQSIDDYLLYGLAWETTTDLTTNPPTIKFHTKLASDPYTASVPATEYAGTLSETSTSALTDPASQTSVGVSGTAIDTAITVGGTGVSASSAVSGAAYDTGVDAVSSTTVATYTTSPVSVISLTDTGARRAKKLSRKVLNRLRK